ncbi:hypothetical protein [Microbispora sp. CA-102843]|uniref:hypothetical protein n=1 Tax=Microbispora sp. CA-102843 TaxID=3239952 RepID=UPI003D91CE77
MIVISAASGALGRLVIEHLRTRTEVVAAVRDPARAPEGVPARRGDYDDPASLREALGVPYREVPDAGPGPMSWINAQIRAGMLEQRTDDLERVLCRPAETVVSRALGSFPG